MKNFFIFISMLCVVGICSLNNNFTNEIFSNFQTSKVSFYCEDYQENIKNYDVNIIENGSGFIVNCKAVLGKEIQRLLIGTSGFSIEVENIEENLQWFLNQITILKTENVGEIKVYYAQKNGLIFSDIIYGHMCNLQLAINGDKIIVGSPIILGSF